jgi:hypothetical protein
MSLPLSWTLPNTSAASPVRRSALVLARPPCSGWMSGWYSGYTQDKPPAR